MGLHEIRFGWGIKTAVLVFASRRRKGRQAVGKTKQAVQQADDTVKKAVKKVVG